MKYFTIISFSLVLFVSLAGCAYRTKNKIASAEDNLLVKELYDKDVQIRKLDAKMDTINLEEYDKRHREQIFQLLAENKVLTPKDKIRAAWILQHTAARLCDGQLTSISPENFLMAYKLSSSALSQLEKEKDTLTIRKENVPRIIALNYDRYLLFSFGYQKFGTQFVFDEKTDHMLLAPIDTTLANDSERQKHNVESLSTLLSKYKIKPMPKQ